MGVPAAQVPHKYERGWGLHNSEREEPNTAGVRTSHDDGSERRVDGNAKEDRP